MKLPLRILILALCSTALHSLYAAADEQKTVCIEIDKHHCIALPFSDETTIKELKESLELKEHMEDKAGKEIVQLAQRLSLKKFRERLQKEEYAQRSDFQQLSQKTRRMPSWWPTKLTIVLEDDKSCSYYGIQDKDILTLVLQSAQNRDNS